MNQAILKIEGLVKRYGSFVATDSVNLEIYQNEVHALIGPNGAGKSTLANLISGNLMPSEGTIRLGDHALDGLRPHQRAKLGIGRGFQVASLFTEETVLDNLTIALKAHLERATALFDHPKTRGDIAKRARAILQETGLRDRIEVLVSNLSHGERKQLDLILAQAIEPRLLLLDEPMAGLGHTESLKMLNTLQGLRGKTSILLIEHDMDAVFSLADRISVLVYGRVIATGTVDEIRANKEVQRSYLGDEESK